MRFLAALSLLTILPARISREATPEELKGSPGYFPVVGILIGLFLAGFNWVFGLFLPQAITNLLLLVSMVIITGALHLDGFADTCDGMAGNKTVEERWQVMRDSRIGAFGVVGLVLLLLLKYVTLNSIPANLLTFTLIVMPVVSRWAMVYAISAHPYARSEGTGKLFKEGTSWRSFTAATIVTLLVIIGLAGLTDLTYFYLAGLAIMLGTWVVILFLAGYLKRKFSGLTGDTYGAVNEVAEVCVLISVSLLAFNQWFS